MTNILVVFTGGTIGSTALDGVICPSEQARYQLLELFRQQYRDANGIHFHTIQPLNLLSENLAPDAWGALVDAVRRENPERYDGIIITHGTDTLAYSAAAMGFCFHAFTKPILLVSSDYPLTDVRANGLGNFICAVDYIEQVGDSGVFVPYRNPGQDHELHQGTRLASSLQLSGDFYSVQGKSHLRYADRQFVPVNPSNRSQSGRAVFPSLKARFSDGVALVRPYPGLNYQQIGLQGVSVVLHDLYHSGTACVTREWGGQFSLLAFLQRCQALAVKVYLAPALHSPDLYLTARQLVDAGAEVIWNMSMEAAYVKLMLAYGNFTDPDEINRFIHSDCAGEFV